MSDYDDRANGNVIVANARIVGLDTDLNLSDTQFNNCLMIFFFPYALFEVPSNTMLKRFRPSVWLSIIVLIWGVSMTLMGVVKNYSGLLATRFFLGVGEVSTFGDVDRRKVTIANNIGILLFLGWVFSRSKFLTDLLVLSP